MPGLLYLNDLVVESIESEDLKVIVEYFAEVSKKKGLKIKMVIMLREDGPVSLTIVNGRQFQRLGTLGVKFVLMGFLWSMSLNLNI